jgi:hypothetical protein
MEKTRALYETAIPPELWSRLRTEGLLRGDAPIPAVARAAAALGGA